MKITSPNLPVIHSLILSLALCFQGINLVYAEDAQILKAVHVNNIGVRWWATLETEGNKISGSLGVKWNEKEVTDIKCKKAKIKSSGKFKLWCKGHTSKNRSLAGTLNQAKLTASGAAGGAMFRFVTGQDLEKYLLAVEENPELTTDQFLDDKG